MAVLVLLSIILVRNLKVENPGKKQLVLETIITTFNNLFKGVIGEAGMKYVPYLITVILYIGMANIMGVFGFKPPTKDRSIRHHEADRGSSSTHCPYPTQPVL